MEKLIHKMKNNPKNVRFSELERLIFKAGYELARVKGSHHVYVKEDKILTIIKPHGGRKFCHPQDVRDVLKLLEKEKEK